MKPCPFCNLVDDHDDACYFTLQAAGAMSGDLQRAWDRRVELATRCRAEGGNTNLDGIRKYCTGEIENSFQLSTVEDFVRLSDVERLLGTAPAAGTDKDAELPRAEIARIAGSCMESGRYSLFMGKIDAAIGAHTKAGAPDAVKIEVRPVDWAPGQPAIAPGMVDAETEFNQATARPRDEGNSAAEAIRQAMIDGITTGTGVVRIQRIDPDDFNIDRAQLQALGQHERKA